MTGPRDLAALTRLTGAVFATRQARMGILRQAEQTIRDKLSSLDLARKARAQSLTEADPALQAGADLLWQSWIELRRAALNAELSQILVAQEAARAALGQAFGRDQATLGLCTQAAAARLKVKARRDDFTS